MLSLLQSIFGNHREGAYPESLVKAAIERTVDCTDPWLRAVSGYRKKLRPSVIRSIDFVVSLVNRLPPSLPLSLAGYTDDKVMKKFFISQDDLRKVLVTDRALADFLGGEGKECRSVYALLGMEKQERVGFGVALSGDIVIRDVPQVTVSFDIHRFLDPTCDERENRRQLMRRAFDHLLSLALKRLAGLKSERRDLERWRALLQAKLALLEKVGVGFGDATDDITTFEEKLGRIEAQLKELGGEDRVLDVYLDVVVDLLGHPEQYLVGQQETVLVDSMGIKHEEPAEDVVELPLLVASNAEGRHLVVLPVMLQVAELRGLKK
ncbi:hypothetical protein GEOBRER4_n3647 [Citrifermentans bremense]|uniref:Uncharacterized protein n=1 Tax=Citrifermentans bremense TaxID=60035 RepID=A0A6S6M325_9BACT|nr:hypothetical protein [Citrifermentans bremense]BCG48752.1 hypothetical protein GEOBRER4_n3647 [Citrifermentans bremense]